MALSLTLSASQNVLRSFFTCGAQQHVFHFPTEPHNHCSAMCNEHECFIEALRVRSSFGLTANRLEYSII